MSAQLMSLKKGCILISSAPALAPSLLAGSRISSLLMMSCTKAAAVREARPGVWATSYGGLAKSVQPCLSITGAQAADMRLLQTVAFSPASASMVHKQQACGHCKQ